MRDLSRTLAEHKIRRIPPMPQRHHPLVDTCSFVDNLKCLPERLISAFNSPSFSLVVGFQFFKHIRFIRHTGSPCMDKKESIMTFAIEYLCQGLSMKRDTRCGSWWPVDTLEDSETTLSSSSYSDLILKYAFLSFSFELVVY